MELTILFISMAIFGLIGWICTALYLNYKEKTAGVAN